MARARPVAVLLAALALCASAQAARGPAPVRGLQAPDGVKAFLLRASDPAGRSFSRTPSFGWNPVPGAKRYEFELATSKRFTENALIWEKSDLKGPAVAVPLSLPWITGESYSLYAHVRAVTAKGVSAWSTPYGFNMRWPNVPAPLASQPGLLRWSTVPGATRYAVWLVDVGKIFTTLSNVADEREYYTFHQGSPWPDVVHWRVRAMRWLYGSPMNSLPAVSYGPWSPVYTSYNPPFALGPLTPTGTVSDVSSDALSPRSHRLMPAFFYSGNQSIWGTPDELYRVYVFTDKDCLNMVFRGAIVGSPAYAPRPTGPLGLPQDVPGITAARSDYLDDGDEGATFTYDGLRVISTEAGTSPGAGGGGAAPTGGQAGNGTSIPADQVVTGAKVDLWDTDWPTGRDYWIVMPVEAVASQATSTTLSNSAAAGATTITVGNASSFAAGDALTIGTGAAQETVVVVSVTGNTITLSGGVRSFHAAGDPVVRPAGAIEYRDAELTQDACAAGRVLTFGKSSEPVVTASSAPYASGLSPTGRLYAASKARPKFYGPPLVAWEPALAADQYEVQWSRTLYPWRTAGNAQTFATAMTLPLTPGTWYYRVRGLDYSIPGGKQQMSWSDPIAVVVTKPRFRVVR